MKKHYLIIIGLLISSLTFAQKSASSSPWINWVKGIIPLSELKFRMLLKGNGEKVDELPER
jgi:hypothetical protein